MDKIEFEKGIIFDLNPVAVNELKAVHKLRTQCEPSFSIVLYSALLARLTPPPPPSNMESAHRYRYLISILRRDQPIVCKEASFIQIPFVYSELFLKLGTSYAVASGSVPPEPVWRTFTPPLKDMFRLNSI